MFGRDPKTQPKFAQGRKELLEKEVLFQIDLERLIGKRPFDKPTNYEKHTKNGFDDVLEGNLDPLS